jgi:hypothetical protein
MNKEELKVGMYIRTIYGYIAKIKKINENSIVCDSQIFQATSFSSEHTKILKLEKIEQIKNVSNNILDLLEPMDLLYIDISPDNYGGIVVPRVAETKAEIDKWKIKFVSGECILKTILTKEQIIKNRYEVNNYGIMD